MALSTKHCLKILGCESLRFSDFRRHQWKCAVWPVETVVSIENCVKCALGIICLPALKFYKFTGSLSLFPIHFTYIHIHCIYYIYYIYCIHVQSLVLKRAINQPASIHLYSIRASNRNHAGSSPDA